MEKKQNAHLMGALIISLIIIVIELVLYFTNQMQNKGLGLISYLVFIIGICMICLQYSKEKDGNVTFGNLFAQGFKTSALVALIMIIWSVLMFKVLFPDLPDQLMQSQRAKMLSQGLSEEQMAKGAAIGKKFFMTFVIGGTIFMYAILGAIASLIGAAIAKKNPKAANPFGE
ncbi:DUF4199 domain-containing protein [Arachidicoccus sp.]|uniref:DUF4199 domain-containing protein n=1 Tax=Arachidicoccus sp. TaxID=1872624 RepID=UPI003D1FBEFA